MGKPAVIMPIEDVLAGLAYHLSKIDPMSKSVAKIVLDGYVDNPNNVGFFVPLIPIAFKLAETAPKPVLCAVITDIRPRQSRRAKDGCNA